MTDMAIEVDKEWTEVLPLKHDIPGWWSKIEAFGIQGPVLYLDLDTVIVGDLTPLAEAILSLRKEQILMLRRFRKPGWASGIMGWTRDWSWLLDLFLAQEKRFIRQDKGWSMRVKHGNLDVSHYRGDQEWIEARLNERLEDIRRIAAQDVCPGIYSYKHHVRGNKEMPVDARIICFHGHPRPSEVQLS